MTAVCNQISDLVELTKPRITLVVLVTAFTGMWLAGGGVPAPQLAIISLLGIGLASAASSVLNNYIDRNVDRYMSRTRNRALPAGRLHPNIALYFGLLLTLCAFAILFIAANLLTAVLAVLTVAFYVCIYTIWLKRRSSLCTEIGGIAGALPPVIGWAAVTGDLAWPAFALFVVMLLWQPSHFWALALLRADEYRAAKLPMLPVTHGVRATKQRMLVYTLILIPASISMYSLQLTGPRYLLVAAILGLLYLVITIRFIYRPGIQGAGRVFGFSIFYLVALFTMMYIDCQYAGEI
jgi:protoheme IX farnesyltransferase